MIVRVGILIASAALVWLVAFVVASYLDAGEHTLPLSASALAICLLPAVATLVVAERAAQSNPEAVGIAFLGGTLFRMLVVAVAALALMQVEPFRRHESWLYWVVGFYLVTLALETALIVVGRKNQPTA